MFSIKKSNLNEPTAKSQFFDFVYFTGNLPLDDVLHSQLKLKKHKQVSSNKNRQPFLHGFLPFNVTFPGRAGVAETG